MIFRGFKGYAVSGKLCSLVGLGFSSKCVCSTPISQGDGALENVSVLWGFGFPKITKKGLEGNDQNASGFRIFIALLCQRWSILLISFFGK